MSPPIPGPASAGPASPGVTYEAAALDRQARWAALGATGATIWFTGLSGSGKSAIAACVESRLVCVGIHALRLDGDNLRHGLNGDLGFSEDDRIENVRRVAHVACLLAESGLVAVVCLISPYAEGRRHARVLHEAAGIDFIEVFVDTPLVECERRDPKGLYARARAGSLSGMSGVDDPYEAPERPELVVGDPGMSVAESSEVVLGLLGRRGISSTT